MAAFKGKPLGNFHYCPIEKISAINRPKLIEYRHVHFTADNCILAGAAVDHEIFVKFCEKKFGGLGNSGSLSRMLPASPFTGGLYVEQRELKEEFVKCAVAFNVGGWRSPDFVSYCVLQQLLGGGSSFSAGGPGKGMYTRLYRELLNKYGWVESSEAFVNSHNEEGILGIDGACKADAVVSMIQVSRRF